MATEAHITSELFSFLRDLSRNNDREWFGRHKGRYERHVKEALQRFIVDFGPLLEGISPHFAADPRPVGGSLFRIYRDTRFSRDKSPYKENAGVQFRHLAGKDAHAPGFYLHLQPDEVFVGVGMWRPDGPATAAVRDAMVADPAAWTRVMEDPAFAGVFSLGGERLKRPPRGYPKDHPLVEDLKRKDFIATCPLSEAEACAPDFLERFAGLCRAAAPLQRYLCEALGQPF